jgi:hypothetical protein
MTPDDAKERLRDMCIEAMDIAEGQGWDWHLSATIKGRPGYMFHVFTDQVRNRTPDKRQLPLIPEETTT